MRKDLEKEQLPPFLSTKVIGEFKNSLDDQEAFRRLISGIKGIPIGSSESLELMGNSDPYKGLDFFDVRDFSRSSSAVKY